MSEIDGIVRKVIEDEGYGEFFITRTGHGVGLSVHEPPMCSSDSEDICRAGMCFSIEPGIYIPGKTGVRIEDLVIVTENGCRVLTHYPKDLLVV
jgi:Xaa-Pro dipeptidase